MSRMRCRSEVQYNIRDLAGSIDVAHESIAASNGSVINDVILASE